MIITVKQLQGRECNLEAQSSTLIIDIKKEIQKQLHIPIKDQKLLLLGRTLFDDQPLESYPNIKDGTKINLVVKKPPRLLDVATRHFRKRGMKNAEANSAAHHFVRRLEANFAKLSWDDINRLAYNCLLEEGVHVQCDSIIEED